MTVQDTLKECLLLYPSIFPNKWSVYHHWFCVNGNGYEWVDGELVDGEKTGTVTIKDAIEKHFEFHVSDRELLTRGLKYSISSLKDSILMTLDLENRILDFEPKEKIYPLCEYAKIVNIPTDIKDDWKSAVSEFYHFLISIYDTLDDDNKKFIDGISL